MSEYDLRILKYFLDRKFQEEARASVALDKPDHNHEGTQNGVVCPDCKRLYNAYYDECTYCNPGAETACLKDKPTQQQEGTITP